MSSILVYGQGRMPNDAMASVGRYLAEGEFSGVFPENFKGLVGSPAHVLL